MEWVKSLRSSASASEENANPEPSTSNDVTENNTNTSDQTFSASTSPSERIRTFMTDPAVFKNAASKSWKSMYFALF
jgi:hypothetical protein